MSRLVIFDLDGTLVDSRLAIAATFDAAVQSRGYPPVAHEDVIKLIGLRLSDMFPIVLPELQDPLELEALVDAYKVRYLDLANQHERAIVGIEPLLARLVANGRTLAIATSKSTRGAHRATRDHGMHHHFAALYGTDAVDHPKPHPQMVQRIMAQLDIGPDETVVVGDTDYDMLMGRDAGAKTIGVTWGSHGPDRLGIADHMVDTVPQLAATLGLAT